MRTDLGYSNRSNRRVYEPLSDRKPTDAKQMGARSDVYRGGIFDHIFDSVRSSYRNRNPRYNS